MRWALGIAAVALLFGAACGKQEKVPTAPLPAPAPAPPPAPLAQAPVPALAAPAPASAPAAPAATPAAAAPAASAASDSAGATLYATNCASCHGPNGDGDGPVGAALVPKPTKHSDGNYMNPLTNEHLFKTIKEGGAAVGKSPMMAPWGGVLTDAQIWDVIKHVRAIAKPPFTGSVP